MESGAQLPTDGFAAFQYPQNGDVYEGMWKSGKPHGGGVYSYATGAKYEGEWRNGLRHGFGIYVDAKGGKYSGEWKDGCKSGLGVFVFANGDLYDGEWASDRTHGTGLYKFASGKTVFVKYDMGNCLERQEVVQASLERDEIADAVRRTAVGRKTRLEAELKLKVSQLASQEQSERRAAEIIELRTWESLENQARDEAARRTRETEMRAAREEQEVRALTTFHLKALLNPYAPAIQSALPALTSEFTQNDTLGVARNAVLMGLVQRAVGEIGAGPLLILASVACEVQSLASTTPFSSSMVLCSFMADQRVWLVLLPRQHPAPATESQAIEVLALRRVRAVARVGDAAVALCSAPQTITPAPSGTGKKSSPAVHCRLSCLILRGLPRDIVELIISCPALSLDRCLHLRTADANTTPEAFRTAVLKQCLKQNAMNVAEEFDLADIRKLSEITTALIEAILSFSSPPRVDLTANVQITADFNETGLVENRRLDTKDRTLILTPSVVLFLKVKRGELALSGAVPLSALVAVHLHAKQLQSAALLSRGKEITVLRFAEPAHRSLFSRRLLSLVSSSIRVVETSEALQKSLVPMPVMRSLSLSLSSRSMRASSFFAFLLVHHTVVMLFLLECTVPASQNDSLAPHFKSFFVDASLKFSVFPLAPLQHRFLRALLYWEVARGSQEYVLGPPAFATASPVSLSCACLAEFLQGELGPPLQIALETEVKPEDTDVAIVTAASNCVAAALGSPSAPNFRVIWEIAGELAVQLPLLCFIVDRIVCPALDPRWEARSGGSVPRTATNKALWWPALQSVLKLGRPLDARATAAPLAISRPFGSSPSEFEMLDGLAELTTVIDSKLEQMFVVLLQSDLITRQVSTIARLINENAAGKRKARSDHGAQTEYTIADDASVLELRLQGLAQRAYRQRHTGVAALSQPRDDAVGSPLVWRARTTSNSESDGVRLPPREPTPVEPSPPNISVGTHATAMAKLEAFNEDLRQENAALRVEIAALRAEMAARPTSEKILHLSAAAFHRQNQQILFDNELNQREQLVFDECRERFTLLSSLVSVFVAGPGEPGALLFPEVSPDA